MILVTVGGQLPFDRLVRAVDEWAATRGRGDLFAQIGETDYRPEHMEWTAFLEPAAFQERFDAASAIVSHAGMGTIISALEAGKPVIVLPRQHALGEQRNDHQLATAEHLRDRSGVIVAMNETELAKTLDGIDALGPFEETAEGASPELLEVLRNFAEEAPQAPSMSAEEGPARRFDGVICFGGVDWWYHNRGHYDLQLMRELSRTVPVLYVNSIAMRMPKLAEGGMFFRRVWRKLRSLQRGMHLVRPTFGVFSPFALPGRLGTTVSRFMVPWQIKRAARRLGIRAPLVWVACPPAERFLDALRPVGLVYQRTDRFEAFPGVDPDFIGSCSDELVRRSDIVLYCSRLLMEEEQDDTPNAVFLDHGVDYEAFHAAGEASVPPPDVVNITSPRIVFVGGIDAQTFDPDLFRRVVELLPEAQFVLVGACSLPVGWCEAPNVHLLGQRPYEEVASYMAAGDVLIMPWNQSEWIRACNPVKLKEYLAVGRPIVTTDFYELRHYEGLVRVARDPEGFAAAIRDGLEAPPSPAAGRERVREETWEHKGRRMFAELASRGLEPPDDGPSPALPR